MSKGEGTKMHEENNSKKESLFDTYRQATADAFKSFSETMKAPTFDRETVIQNHKKNVEAINDANKMAVEVLKTISQLQTQYMRQTFDDIGSMVRDMASTQGKRDQNPMAAHSDRMRQMMTRSFDHSSEIAKLMAKSQQDSYGKFSEQFSQHFDEFKRAAEKKKH